MSTIGGELILSGALAALLLTVWAGSGAAQTGGHADHGGQPVPAAQSTPRPQAHGGHVMAPSDAAMLGVEQRGGEVLEPEVVDGVRVFSLSASVVRWAILPDVSIAAYVYNEQLPGPTIRVPAGEPFRVRLRNALPEPTTIHWHGLVPDIRYDGVPSLSQVPVEPGGEFLYELTADVSPGTYFYHSHFAADRQQPLGLFGALIVDGPEEPDVAADYTLLLAEHRVEADQVLPAMDFEGMLPNYFTINGKSYPATDVVRVKVGDRVRLRLIGAGQFIHPMHVHGGAFEIIGTDGNPVPDSARLHKDTVLVGPGERYDVLWTARRPGRWLVHCHINHHMTNDGQEVDGAGGLAMIIEAAA